MAVLPADGVEFDFDVLVVVVGAGACGLVAALAAHDAGQEVMILERDATPQGSTSLSAGLIPAAGTRLQRGAGWREIGLGNIRRAHQSTSSA